MEYVQGESLSRLLRHARARGRAHPAAASWSRSSRGALHGLHAAHEAKDERGEPLEHRPSRRLAAERASSAPTASPRVLDFGVAKAAGRAADDARRPDQGQARVHGAGAAAPRDVDRATDIYAAGVVLWELLTGQRLFKGETEASDAREGPRRAHRAAEQDRAGIPEELDAVAMRASRSNPADRFGTAREMALAIEACISPASAGQVGEWVELVASDSLGDRERIVASIETGGEGGIRT